MIYLLSEIGYTEFTKHLGARKEVLNIYIIGGMAVVHEFYKSKNKDIVVKGFFYKDL